MHAEAGRHPCAGDGSGARSLCGGSGALVPRLGDEERRETAELVLGQPGADEDALRAILTELDRRTEGVELGELPALGVGNEQLDDGEAAREALSERRAQGVQSLARPSRDRQ